MLQTVAPAILSLGEMHLSICSCLCTPNEPQGRSARERYNNHSSNSNNNSNNSNNNNNNYNINNSRHIK